MDDEGPISRLPPVPSRLPPAASVRRVVVDRAGQDEPGGLDDDLDVEEGGPGLDIIEVVARALLDRGVDAQTVDLCRAGDAGLLVVPVVVAWERLAEALDEVGALGAPADDAQLAEQHVAKLR